MTFKKTKQTAAKMCSEYLETRKSTYTKLS